jgi:hypothetical protein
MWEEEDGGLWDRVIDVIGIDCTFCDLADLVGNAAESLISRFRFLLAGAEMRKFAWNP